MITSRINLLLILRNMALYILLIIIAMLLSNAKMVYIVVFVSIAILYDLISKLTFSLLFISVKDDSVCIKYLKNFQLKIRVVSISNVKLIIKRGNIARGLLGDILTLNVNGEDLGNMVLVSSGWSKESIEKVNNSLVVIHSTDR